jgi:hypothetical protein
MNTMSLTSKLLPATGCNPRCPRRIEWRGHEAVVKASSLRFEQLTQIRSRAASAKKPA